MAEFAIGSIATMANSNPKIEIPGFVPHLGSHLTVRRAYLLPLLVGIALVHSLLVLGSIWFHRRDLGRGSCIVLRSHKAAA